MPPSMCNLQRVRQDHCCSAYCTGFDSSLAARGWAGRARRVAALGRYPVKSMLGEDLRSDDVAGQGLLGDCSHALLD